MTFRIAVSEGLSPYLPDFPVLTKTKRVQYAMSLVLVKEDAVWLERQRAVARPFFVERPEDCIDVLKTATEAGLVGKFRYIDPSSSVEKWFE